MDISSFFNPYILHLNVGQLWPGQVIHERMCLFHEIELITFSSGGGVITLDQFLPARRGTIYIRRPGMIVRGIAPYHFNGIIFDTTYDPALEPTYRREDKAMRASLDTDHLRRLESRHLSFDFLDSLPPRIEVRNVDLFSHLFSAAFHLYIDQPEHYQLHAKTILLQILVALLEEQGNPRDDSALNSIANARQFMDTHYMEPITLARLAEPCALSVEHFCRSFKRLIGRAPLQYLTSIRVFHAKRLLLTTNDTIERIATQCGFSSPQYFYSVFKRETNATPTAFRHDKK